MATLSFAQLQELWIRNGGNPLSAPIMAAIALAESGGRTDAANTKPPDASYGLWQINYYGPLAPGRTAAYGTPAQLVADPDRQAKAAIAISGNGSNLKPWSTYTSGAAQRVLTSNGGSLGAIPALPPLSTSGPAGVTGGADEEGLLVDITMPSAIPNIKIGRAPVRKVLGVVVLAAGGVVGLAGVFVLMGGKSAPGPSRVVATAIRQRGQTSRTRLEEQGKTERSPANRPPNDDLAERRRQRERARREQSKVDETLDARRQGEEDARRAGPFD